MPSFGIRKLRQKFQAIVLLALLLPFLLYGFFLSISLRTLEEIEEKTLESELLRAESYLRRELAGLIDISEHVSGLLESEISQGLAWETAWESSGIGEWLRASTHTDLAIGWVEDGSPVLLFARESGGPTMEKGTGEAWTAGRAGGGGCSGFATFRGNPYMITVQPLSARQEGASGFLALGIDVRETLLPPINMLLPERVRVIVPSSENPPAHQGTTTLTRTGESVVTITKVLAGLEPEGRFALQLTLDSGLFSQLRASLIWQRYLVMGLILAAGLVATSFATGMVLRPLRRLSEAMASVVGPEEYGHRAPEEGNDEIAELARSFNLLMARLEEAQAEIESAQLRRMESEKIAAIHATVVTLSHQINNPLAALLGQAELLLLHEELDPKARKSLETIRDMSLRISAVIRKLQELERVETTAYLRTAHMIKLDSPDDAEAAATPSRVIAK
ncbi:MAG: HAMP domain-containing protein [Candidatus Omnitrophica bacterium]|nr:hypothetical protein [bacterium]NUN94778.1 HAMP domain-containing protein [Candidatus Omnitrophota bacterium]